MKKLVFASVVALCCLLMVGCSEESDTPLFPEDKISEEMNLELSGWKVDSLDKKNKVIHVKPTKGWLDSLVIDSLALPGSSALYLAADDDLIDPDLGEKLLPGTVISTVDTNQVSIVALDSYNRVVGVWLVVWDLPKTPKSSEHEASSSSTAKPGSSDDGGSSSDSSAGTSSDTSSESSSDTSSSSEESGSGGSSSELTDDSSSSEGTISSSSEAAQPQAVKLADLSVEGGTITVEDSRVYVEMPYGTDLSAITLSPLDAPNDLIRPVEMQFEDADGNVGTYNVVTGVQLPGSDFSARNDFWATTSDAMATAGEGKYRPALVNWTITMSSGANAAFDGTSLSLSSKIVTGVASGIAVAVDDGFKLAGGFYYAGSFSGTNCASIYQASNSEASPDDAADFSQYMSHGQAFTARPQAFEVRYMYSHQQNSNVNYPQKALIYVVLVSANDEIVASGVITEDGSVDDWKTQNVTLDYGSDNGLLSAEYAGLSGLTTGTGDEDVASIRVMFASSAYAYVADGGEEGSSGKYRGGENSSLTLDDFKLIY